MIPDSFIIRHARSYVYDPLTGHISRNGRVIRGKRNGYIKITVEDRQITGHRLAWFLYYGCFPFGEIDHINGDKADNRLCNLRDVDASTNRMNQARRSDNSSGVTGVIFHSTQRKWIAQICVRGRRRQLGSFSSREAAIAARRAAQATHGFGPNHGRGQP